MAQVQTTQRSIIEIVAGWLGAAECAKSNPSDLEFLARKPRLEDQEVSDDLVRLVSHLARVVLGDAENPVIREEVLDLAHDLVETLLGGFDQSFRQVALERLRGLCREYDIE